MGSFHQIKRSDNERHTVEVRWGFFFFENLTYFLFLRAVVNMPIQTLIIPSWLLLRKMIISQLELGPPVVQATIPRIPPHPHKILGWIQPHPKKIIQCEILTQPPYNLRCYFFSEGTELSFIWYLNSLKQFFRCRFVDFPLVLIKVYHLT